MGHECWASWRAEGNSDGENGKGRIYARFHLKSIQFQEDLDLLSFSGLDSQVHSTQGPPLKAVYRGAAVGIRYQYPLTVPATSPAVRITQILFFLFCRGELPANDKLYNHAVVPPFSGQLRLRGGCCAVHQRHPTGVPMQGEHERTTTDATDS